MAAVSAITILNANPVPELYPLNNRELIGRGEHEYKDGGEVAVMVILSWCVQGQGGVV